MDKVRRLGILVLDGSVVFSLSPMGSFAAFANEELRHNGAHTDPIQIDFVGDGRSDHVVTSDLLRVHPTAILPSEPYDAIFISVLAYSPLSRLLTIVDSHPQVVTWLRDQWHKGAIIGAADTGVFLLAATGLLDGRRVAMRPRHAGELQRRHPSVRIDTHTPVTEDARLICAAKGASTFGLPLRLLSRLVGPATVAKTAQRVSLMLDQGSSHPYAVLHLDPMETDRIYVKALHWMQTHLRDAVRLKDMASDLCVSERTLIRHFKAAAGVTPLAYLRELRLEVAHKLLANSTLSLDEIASAVGYTDYTSFARSYREQYGSSPNVMRQSGDSPQRSRVA